MFRREKFQELSAAWAALQPSAQRAWNGTIVKNPDANGEMRQLSGYALYMQLNTNLGMCNISPKETPPVNFDVNVPFTALSVDCSTPLIGPPARFSIKLTFAPTPSPMGSNIFIKASALTTSGRTTMKGKVRHIGRISLGEVTPYDITTLYENIFGTTAAPTPPEYAQIYFHFKAIDLNTGVVTKGWTVMCRYGGSVTVF
jgi:hypothetical protein